MHNVALENYRLISSNDSHISAALLINLPTQYKEKVSTLAMQIKFQLRNRVREKDRILPHSSVVLPIAFETR